LLVASNALARIKSRVFSTFKKDVYEDIFITEIIEPPNPIRKNLYRCDKRFHTEEIKELFEEDKKITGLLLVGGEETMFYKIIGDDDKIDYKLIDTLEVFRDNKQKKGGQSAPRFQRIRLEQITQYTKKIHTYAIKHFNNIKEVIIAGYGEIKDNIKEDIKGSFKLLDTLTISTLDINLVIPKIKELFCNREDAIDIQKYIQDETIVFGVDIKDMAEKKLLEKIFIDKTMVSDDILKKYETCQIIKVRNRKLQEFGGIIGITYYPTGRLNF